MGKSVISFFLVTGIWMYTLECVGQEEKQNLNSYTPSVLLSKGQVEVKLFNNLYTQKEWFNGNSEKEFVGRQTFMANHVQLLYGFGSVNLGFDVNIRSVSLDTTNTSPFEVFKFESNNNARTTIGSIGPKIKFSPFKSLDKLSVQSSFWIPVSKDMEGTPWIAWQKLTWWTQIFYDQRLSDKFNLFSEIDFLVRIKTDQNSKSHVSTPLSAFFSYFPGSKSTVYLSAQYAPLLSSDGYSFYAQAGVGVKLQVFPSFEVEVSASDFFAGKNQGAGGTVNLGLRYLK